MATRGQRKKKVLVLWNSVEEDIYEQLKKDGPKPLSWAPEKESTIVETVGDEMRAIRLALREKGYQVRVVNLEDDLDHLILTVRSFRPDAILNLVEIFADDPILESAIAGLFDLLGVPYTGATPLCLATCQRKFRTKVMLAAEGVPTPRHRLVERLPLPRRLGLGYPLIVKPVREDASGGVNRESVVYDRSALEKRVAWVLEHFAQPALIETYIHGREIHAAVMGNDPPRVLPLMEVLFEDGGPREPQILSYDAKWDPESRDFYSFETVVPPRRLPPGVARRIRDIALRSYRCLGCRDYARVDMRLDAEGNPFVLEVNPNPDLVSGTGFMACGEAGGRSFAEILSEIVEMAIARRPART
jgi:D-alanine-D-alanine ligase